MKEEYNKDYFKKGIKKKVSCYENYSWIPTRTLETASELIRRANIKKKDQILDYGCAFGFLVKSFRWLGYSAYGYETSNYALKNVDKEVKDVVWEHLPFIEKDNPIFDVIICKDVAEHIMPDYRLKLFLKEIYNHTIKKAIFIIPLGDGKKYNIPRFELDKTHKIRQTKQWWKKKIESVGFKVKVMNDNMDKLKPNWNVPNGNVYIEAIK